MAQEYKMPHFVSICKQMWVYLNLVQCLLTLQGRDRKTTERIAILLEFITRIIQRLMHSLSFKLSFTAGAVAFVAVAAMSLINLENQRSNMIERVEQEGAGFAETVRRATYWSMLRNQRDSLHQIINDLGTQPGVLAVRVFNKEGEIMFSSSAGEIGSEVDKQAEACYGCHAQQAPLSRLPTNKRSRTFKTKSGEPVLGTILPIYNEPACSNGACHAHPPGQQVLGVLDVDLSLARAEREMSQQRWRTLGFGVGLFLLVSTLTGLGIILTVNRSVKTLVREVDKVGSGDLEKVEAISAPDELDQVAQAFNRMAENVLLSQRQRDRRYRQLVYNSTDAVVLMDRRGRLLMANPEAGRILGQDHHELEGQSTLELVEPADRPVLQGAIEAAMSQDRPTDILRFRVQTPDGPRVLEGRFRRMATQEDGAGSGSGGLLANLRDITSSQDLEDEVLRRRAFEQQLIHLAINAVLATDATGTVQIFNQSAEELFNIEAAEVVGQYDYTRFFPRAQVRVLQKAVFSSPHEGSSLRRPAVIKTVDGRRLPVTLHARALFQGGEFSGVVLFLQNLRETKHLKAMLLQKTRLAAVGQTAAGLAHCMKNLVHGLGASSYLVDQGLAENDVELANQGWRMVKKNLEQMKDLTQDLLSYSRDRRPEYQPFDLNRLLEECVSLVEGRVAETGVEIKLELDPVCQKVVLDPRGVRRVVLNLLSNSLDALAEKPPAGGSGIITLADGRDGFGQVWISVSDNGPGLPPAVRKHLFNGIFSTKGSKGTGLGLLVSQKIAEEHGGVLDVHSLPQGGVRFTLLAPDLGESHAEQ